MGTSPKIRQRNYDDAGRKITPDPAIEAREMLDRNNQAIRNAESANDGLEELEALQRRAGQ